MLKQELQVKLRTTLNLLLRNQVEVLLYPVQELEQLLKEEKESNPFIEEVYVSDRIYTLFEDRKPPEASHRQHPLEILTRNLKAELEGRDLEIALELVSGVDERGFFRGSIGEIARRFGVSKEEVERVRHLVLRCEPPGVCSKDLREFLLLQIEEMYPGRRRLLSRRLPRSTL